MLIDLLDSFPKCQLRVGSQTKVFRLSQLSTWHLFGFSFVCEGGVLHRLSKQKTEFRCVCVCVCLFDGLTARCAAEWDYEMRCYQPTLPEPACLSVCVCVRVPVPGALPTHFPRPMQRPDTLMMSVLDKRQASHQQQNIQVRHI